MSRLSIVKCSTTLLMQKDGVSQEDMVSSSSQEPRSRSVSVQTSPRLMKNGNKRSGGFRDLADKPSKDIIDKVSRNLFPVVFCLIFTCCLKLVLSIRL
jgi:hypothetical protein